MDILMTILTFLQSVIQNLDFASITVGGILGALILAAYAKWTPNQVVYNFFYGLGRKLSRKAGKKLGRQRWENIENNLLGTVTAAASGFQDGANSDDDED